MDDTTLGPDMKGAALYTIRLGLKELFQIPEIERHLEFEHVEDTPKRFAAALRELLSGCWQDPKEILSKSFNEAKYSELIIVRDIDFVSLCSHHLLPFIGKVHFGYIPEKRIVGLSKIARLVEALSRRPQIQEKLSMEIVETFQEVVKPRGCGVVVSASHMCMSIRGVKKPGAMTDTVALQGIFLTEPSVKQEFLQQLRSAH